MKKLIRGGSDRKGQTGMGGQVFPVEGMLWDTTVSFNQPSSYEQEILSRVSLQPRF